MRPLIRVQWVDSASTDAWVPTQEAATTVPLGSVVTVGWLIHEDADRILLAASHFTDWEQVGEIITIPKVAVVSRTTLPESAA